MIFINEKWLSIQKTKIIISSSWVPKQNLTDYAYNFKDNNQGQTSISTAIQQFHHVSLNFAHFVHIEIHDFSQFLNQVEITLSCLSC